MERYVFCKEYNPEMEKRICKNFWRMFHVDLGDDKYYQDRELEKNWEMLIHDVFKKQKKESSQEHIKRFIELVNVLTSGGKIDDITRVDKDSFKQLYKLICEVKKSMSDMLVFPEDYYILESDIYMNAFLSIRFIEAENLSAKDKKGILELDEPGVILAKSYRYEVPFENTIAEKNFCLEYQKCLLGKDTVQIFGTRMGVDEREDEIDVQEIKDFCGYKKRIKISFAKDKKCERWSQKNILRLEQRLQIENRILFHKTINGVLPRNVVDLMIISKKEKLQADDFIYLVDWLCTCDSIRWRNIIGMLTVFGCINKKYLEAYGLWEEFELCIDAWIGQINTINRRLKCLSNALVYMVERMGGGMECIEKRCEDAIAEIEKFPYEFYGVVDEMIREQCCKSVWETAPKKLEKREKTTLTDYWWIYAILQWRIIDNLKSNRCKKMSNSEHNMGWLVYRFAGLYRFVELHRSLSEKYAENGMLEILDAGNSALKKTKTKTSEKVIDCLGGVNGLIEICNIVISSLPKLINESSEDADKFFQILNDETEIKKLFCEAVQEKCGYVLEPKGKEIIIVKKKMMSILWWFDDRLKYPE